MTLRLVRVVFVGILALPFSAGAGGNDRHIATVDHWVDHVSTVPANAGERVKLFLRERFRDHGADAGADSSGKHKPRVVLMIEGSTTPALPVFDVNYQDYSWMEALAAEGFDVFTMDLTGYGASPRPMMDDPCNASTLQQLQYLIPNPLTATCGPSYPFLLTTPDSDLDEIDSAIEYITKRRHVDRVDLVGWSRGGARIGSYAAHHPWKVGRMVMLGPNYGRNSADFGPANLPLPGAAVDVQGAKDFFNLWDNDIKCSDQADPGVRGPVSDAILASDLVGSTWGTEGVRRAPGLHARASTFWGWNKKFAGMVEAPTLIIHGMLDSVVPETQTVPLDQDLGAPHVYLKIDCASHFLAWETRHGLLHQATIEWLRDGTFLGKESGTISIDAAGGVREP